MRDFDYKNTPMKLLSPEVVKLISAIHEHRGKQDLYLEAHKDELNSLLEIAKIQSTGSSNRIEGIYTTDKRLEALVHDKVTPRNRSEEEIAGYRDVLSTIHESYDYIPPRPNLILQLHRDLYSYSSGSVGGTFKNSDNVIAQTDLNGHSTIRFQPVPAHRTPDAMNHLCESFQNAWQEERFDRLLLIPMFILDFLCIHPFNDGNGRMSRLLTLLLIYRDGYLVGKYISIEKIIEASKETYYESLQESSMNWHENSNNYAPFVIYYLGILNKAYLEFEKRVQFIRDTSMSKPDRIRTIINQRIGSFAKKDIIEECPDISVTTIERTLNSLLKSGWIRKIGSGQNTSYVKTEDVT